MKAKLAAAVALAIALSIVGMTFARADDTTPPQVIRTPVTTIVVSANTEGDDQYHQSSTGGHTCVQGGAKDDGTKDNDDCYRSRQSLKTGHADEGGVAACWRGHGGTSNSGVTWDGLWFNGAASSTGECKDPPGTSGRIYTGVAVRDVGQGAVALGGSAAGGCIQAYGQDDTNGNVIAGTVNTVAGTPGSTDDEADVSVCGGIL